MEQTVNGNSYEQNMRGSAGYPGAPGYYTRVTLSNVGSILTRSVHVRLVFIALAVGTQRTNLYHATND